MINQELIKLTTIIDNKIINNINHPDIDYYVKYLCNILDKYDITIEEYKIKLNIYLNGYLDIFRDCYIYGNILYDILRNKKSKIHYKIKVFLKPGGDIKNKYKYIEQFKIMELNDYIIYMINDIEIHLYKSYISPLEIIIRGKYNDENNFLLYEDKILIHPINYYKIYNINDVYINNIEDDKMKMINKIYNNKYDEIEINIDNIDLILNVSIFLSKYKLIERCLNIIINNNMIDYFKKNKNTLFNAIKKNNIYIFQRITKINFDLDIINKEGYNLIEYCLINLNDTTKKIIELIKNYKYNRNPAYVDYILKRNIIEKKIKYDYEKVFYDKIDELHLNKCDNIQLLNNILLDSIYSVKKINPKEEYKIDIIIDFIRFNYDYINKSMLFNKLELMNSVVVVKNLLIEKIIKIDINDDKQNIYEILKLFCYFNLHKNLEENKKYVKLFSFKLLKHCLDINNFKSFICILLLDKNNIFSKDEFNNNILHFIGNDKDIKEIELYIKICVRYNNFIFNSLNNRKENCLYNCVDNDNIKAFEFLINTYNNINITNKNIDGQNILFYIIDKNKLNFLQILFNKYNYVNLLINSRDNFNNTPILFASKKKNINFINYLYKFNPNLDLFDNNNNYIYHYICLYGLITDIKNIKNKKNKNDKSIIDYLNYYIYNSSYY